MADYNPHVPDIVGQEWVPIIGNPYRPDITQERGYSFTVNKISTTPPVIFKLGRFVLDAPPSGVISSQVPFMSVYRKGSEYMAGAPQTAIMQCAGSSTSGTLGAFFGTTPNFQALQNPSDDSGFSFTSGGPTGSGALELAFDPTSLPGVGVRVLNVSLLYTASGFGLQAGTAPNFMSTSVRYRSTDFYYGNGFLDTGPSIRGDLNQTARISLGEINPNWSDATFLGTNDRYPWTETRLGFFSSVAGDPMRIRFAWTFTDVPFLSMHYAALAVTYVPVENRILYGGRHKGIDQEATGTDASYGFISDTARNFVVLRTANSLTTGASTEVAAGEYTVTFNLADYGDANFTFLATNAEAATNTRPSLAATRELYNVPSINGVEIDRQFTPTDQFALRESRIIPGIGVTVTGFESLPCGSCDVYSGCHGFFAPQVGNAISIAAPSQGFRSANNDGTLPYPQVRFYVRQVGGPEDNDGISFSNNSDATQIVRITGEELAALPEIVEGWREVTLRFAVPPPMDGSTTLRNWTWAVVNTADSVRGVAFQVLGANTANPFGNADYQALIGPTSGGTFPFLSPFAGDYTFLFSTDPPTVTGIAVSTQSLALTGIGTECGRTPGCVPMSLNYNRITWPLPAGAAVISDTFNRDVTGGWGTSDSGSAWTTSGGSGTDYSVSVTGSWGIHSVGVVNSPRATITGPATIRDFDVSVDAVFPVAAPTGGAYSSSILGRWTSASNFYEFRVSWSPGNLVPQLSIRRNLSGVDTVLGSVTQGYNNFTTVTNTIIRIRAMAQGSSLFMKAWNLTNNETEPTLWQVMATDTNHVQGQVGVQSRLETGNSNTLPVLFRYDNFVVTPPQGNFGYYELQRSDDDTPWQTIMKATSPAVTGFSDFESRVSMRSDYRIRMANIYDFKGPWSATVSNTLSSPVTGTGADGKEILFFTTNTNQTHGSALGYGAVWDGTPSDEMQYFEGDGMMQFQRMFRRDYQVGFHALERGGVRFERGLLVQNATVPPPVLENAFQSLRDLAWDTVPYICVRTHFGDRWYAVVEVPAGTLTRTRRTQIVQVRITEASDQPWVVDPDPPFGV